MDRGNHRRTIRESFLSRRKLLLGGTTLAAASALATAASAQAGLAQVARAQPQPQPRPAGGGQLCCSRESDGLGFPDHGIEDDEKLVGDGDGMVFGALPLIRMRSRMAVRAGTRREAESAAM